MSNNTENETVTIETLNWEAARMYFGFISFVCVIFLLAVIGNIHILHIYITKKKQTNTRVYVVFIAVLDLINCLICYPYSVVNCLLPYMFYSNTACKVFTLITYTTNTCVPFSLFVISVDRYRVICRPFRQQISFKMSKILCIAASIVSLLLSAPSFVFAGSVAIETGVNGIVGRECNSAGADGVLQKTYIGFYSLLTITGAVVFILLYSLMGCAIRKQQALIKNSGVRLHTLSVSDETSGDGRRHTLPHSFRPVCVNEQDINVDVDIHNQEQDSVDRDSEIDTDRSSNTNNAVFFIEPSETNNISVTKVVPPLEHLRNSKRRHSAPCIFCHRHIGPLNKTKLTKSQSTAAIKFEQENTISFDKVHQNGLLSGEKNTVESKGKSSNLKKLKQKLQHDSQTPLTMTHIFSSPPYRKSPINGNVTKQKNVAELSRSAKLPYTRASVKHVNGDSNVVHYMKKKALPEKERFKRTKRTTIMFFWVTFVYVVSFLPNPALRVARFLNPEWYAGLSLAELTLYYIGHGTVFLASATNFFIYLFCDSMFRTEIRNWYRRRRFCKCLVDSNT